MTKIHYEARPLHFNKALERFEERDVAVRWTSQRNSNPLQTPVRLVEVVTQVQERELSL